MKYLEKKKYTNGSLKRIPSQQIFGMYKNILKVLLLLIICIQWNILIGSQIEEEIITLIAEEREIKIPKSAALYSPVIASIIEDSRSIGSTTNIIKLKAITFKKLSVLTEFMKLKCELDKQQFLSESEIAKMPFARDPRGKKLGRGLGLSENTKKRLSHLFIRGNTILEATSFNRDEIINFYVQSTDFFELAIIAEYLIVKIYMEVNQNKTSVEEVIKEWELSDKLKVILAKTFNYLFGHVLDIKIPYTYSICELRDHKKIPQTIYYQGKELLDLNGYMWYKIDNLEGLQKIDGSEQFEILDLSCNCLTEIPLGVFASFNKLTKLSLNHNPFTALDLEFLKDLPSLRDLELVNRHNIQLQNLSIVPEGLTLYISEYFDRSQITEDFKGQLAIRKYIFKNSN